MGPISKISIYKLATSSGKDIQEISHNNLVCLLCRKVTSARDTDDFFIGFDRGRGRRQQNLTNNKNTEGKFRARIYIKDIFSFAEHMEKATYSSDYRLTLKRNTDNAVLNKDNATAIGKIMIKSVDWFVPIYTPSIEQQALFSNQILNKTPKGLQYVERSERSKYSKFGDFRFRDSRRNKRPYMNYCWVSTKR